MKARSSRKARGGEVQMPVKRYSKAKGNFTNRIEMHEYTYSPTQLQSARSRIRLQPGMRLAAKFPHLVKAAAPTKGCGRGVSNCRWYCEAPYVGFKMQRHTVSWATI